MAIVGQVPGTEHFRNVLRHQVITSDRVLTVRVDESLYFANTRYLEDRVYDLVAARPQLEHVVLMCPAVNFIEASAFRARHGPCQLMMIPKHIIGDMPRQHSGASCDGC
jgi:SulP family sulfate permease